MKNFKVAQFDKYTVKTNMVAISYDALKKAPVSYYKGGAVKDANGKRKITDVNVPVRIDGILEDDKKYFGDTGGVWDERDPNSDFDYSVMYVPLERIEAIENKHADGKEVLGERRVVLCVSSMENMGGVLKELKDKNYSVASSYENYMLMSVMERTYEIGIIKAIGVEVKSIKRIFITEASLLGLFGGVIGVIASFAVVAAMNFAISGNKNIAGNNAGNFKIAEMPWYLALTGVVMAMAISAAASMPAVGKAVKIDVSQALKRK